MIDSGLPTDEEIRSYQRQREDDAARRTQALRDIATAEMIPTPEEAFNWCKQVATAALNPR